MECHLPGSRADRLCTGAEHRDTRDALGRSPMGYTSFDRCVLELQFGDLPQHCRCVQEGHGMSCGPVGYKVRDSTGTGTEWMGPSPISRPAARNA